MRNYTFILFKSITSSLGSSNFSLESGDSSFEEEEPNSSSIYDGFGFFSFLAGGADGGGFVIGSGSATFC